VKQRVVRSRRPRQPGADQGQHDQRGDQGDHPGQEPDQRHPNERDFGTTFETVDWSQARYADYGFIALDVTPAARGRRTTMTLRFINEQGRELDRVVFSRTAGEVLH